MNDEGEVLDSTVTSFNGTYSFDGVQVGRVTVRAELPGGWEATTPAPEELLVTRGEQRFRNVHFGQREAIGQVTTGATARDATPASELDDVSDALFSV